MGCGDDDGDTHDDAGAAGKAGKGGASARSTAGQGGAGSAAPIEPATSVKCGSMTCEASSLAMGFITPCCADEAASTCGTSIMGGACSVPSAGDARCPSIQAMGLFTIPSCCTPGGMCGIDASMFGFPGCTDLATAAMQSQMMGSGSDIPAPRACDGSGAADAGI